MPGTHRLATQDRVSGEWLTRCGLRGYRDTRPLPGPRALIVKGERELLAEHEGEVTCKRCRLRLTPIERKVLKAMAEHGGRTRECCFLRGSMFRIDVGTGLYFYTRGDITHGMLSKGVIQRDAYKNFIISFNGRKLVE